MEAKTVKAVAKYVRTSPRKARHVVDLIRGKKVADAFAILKFTPVKTADDVAKVLKSAVANAEHNNEMNVADLYVHACYVDQGPSMKRIRARAQGRADVIKKRMSHITVIVAEKPAKPVQGKKANAETKEG
ncbi:50S ribosomal protein L22 [Heliophilum fasciatum]|uniref:Large ribosomal subunit protein uL22 n=1 Tax=Heliophilum fasciatum TaxID=35700 RepID=A0A4V2SX57_9FIRM|nr:50S ribosomal protein L22 [Heliophilum fasciatum]MCW2277811.1 large subunit ribosomal protein L22 [Heliophilum fasciatum]TCP64696.1 LSU ribosomal protein L22P [Heliophilum fasciatum]